MPAIARLKREAFFLSDRARGGELGSHVEDIQAILGDPGSTASQSRRAVQVAELLQHAVATVPYYQNLNYNPHDRLSLEHMPVVNKHTFHEHPEAMLSSAHDPKQLPLVHTSGSSGSPLEVPRDPMKRSRHVADLVAFGRMAGHDFGEPMVYLSVSRGQSGHRTMQQRFQGIRYLPAQVHDQDLVERFLKAIAASPRPVTLVGSPSTLEFVGRQLEESGQELPPGTVKNAVAISEAMTPWLAHRSQQVFGGPAVSRYSNEENGIIAQQTASSSSRFVVNHASYVVELLAMDTDRPVPPGEVGRVVLTDLYSRAAPFIRYDTGDLARWSTEQPLELSEILGRQMDIIYATDGRLVAPATILFRLFGYSGIRQFQFAQTGRGTYQLTVIAANDHTRDADMVAALRESLGADADIAVVYADHIDSLPSGKRRPVANLWKPRA